MYAKHNKNINRNKSFHPLTYGNLRKTEEIQEKQEQDAKTQEERTKELHRDQEKRRYDDLVLSASSTGMGVGFNAAAAGGSGALRMVEDIFADDDVEQTTGPALSSSTSAVPTLASSAGQHGSFLAKFKKEESAGAMAPAGNADVVHAGHKRAREDDKTAPSDTIEVTKTTATVTTGFITTSEVARLRAEHELVKKQQLDPLLKVQRHQDRTVAEAARAREKKAKHEEEERSTRAGNGAAAEKSTKQAIQDILKDLQARRRSSS